ncbi:DUF58 domain-containing protein [Microbacterium sp. SSW1-59]|uniref:DUF58 domain-containing protein n=1 Tax=Microbacterium xanthum TaxID=3079794 RepID=UPI002AD294A0|nr:DUF58 domain-containing protein [Microbacterium sp. SSW1-59]MDZ8200036.1 DUF58 domain-containing protein [Microbacterium sp. SSW1-59]
MRRLWPLTGRGTGALVLAVGCLIAAGELGLVELLYFGVLLLAVLAAAILSLFLTRRTGAVERTMTPESVGVGETAVVTARVTVRTAVPTPPGTWRDGLPAGLAGEAAGAFPPLASGLRGSQRVIERSYTVTGVSRGVHAIGPFDLTTTDPFGLARRRTVRTEPTQITVTPAVVDLPGLPDAAGASGGSRLTVDLHLGQGADNLVARPYQSGDSMRRIHWRATAHRDELMVRQEEQESTPEATVVLDLGALRWSPEAMAAPGADDAFETGVSTCVSVVARLVRDGYSVDVVDSDGETLADRIDASEMVEVDALITRFATLLARPDDHLPRLAPVFTGGMSGPVVLIVGRLDPTDIASIAPIAHHSTLPMVLAVTPRADALTAAEDAGWHAAAIPVGGDPAAAWADVGRRLAGDRVG